MDDDEDEDDEGDSDDEGALEGELADGVADLLQPGMAIELPGGALLQVVEGGAEGEGNPSE
jgi:hypothetical protein